MYLFAHLISDDYYCLCSIF